MVSKSAIQVYTDGTCEPNPGAGGYGVVMTRGTRIKKFTSACYAETTNNRMELKAIIFALEHCKMGYRIDIYSDSKYCVDTINKWLTMWIRKGILDTKANDDLWLRFSEIRDKHLQYNSLLTFNWVRGHAGNSFNEMADQLATHSRYNGKRIVCRARN